MISNLEARLVTVVTLWTGEDRVQCCNANVRWVRALVKPYLDHCLRVQTLFAYVPLTPQLPQEFEKAASRSHRETMNAEDEALCVA